MQDGMLSIFNLDGYLVLEEPNQGANEESHRFQVIGDVWVILRYLTQITTRDISYIHLDYGIK